jgi:hypothetical protein
MEVSVQLTSFHCRRGLSHKTSLTTSVFMEAPVKCQERKVCCQVFVCYGIDYSSFYDFFIEVWKCSEIVAFSFLIF